MGDVARIFSSGSPQGDLNVWDQLGLDGEWTGRRIHLYGLRDDGRYASGFRETHMAGRTYAVHYEALSDRRAVANAVALDPFGIGSIGWLGDEWNGRDIRIVPLSKEPEEKAFTPNLDDVSRGRYPLTPCLSLYFDRAPAEPLPDQIRSFLEFTLSDEAQDVLAGFTDETAGYVRLSQADRLEERDKLARL
jgi:phosphate transport system substrate-binding protein